jgi:protein-S-isoprenylcysteine O-methyltransferase Ste14
MKISTTLRRSKPVTIAIGILLACAWGMFSYAHILGFQRSGDWTFLLFCASETLIAVLFLIQSEAATVSTDPVDWLLAICATFSPFFFAPASWGILPAAKIAIVIGVIIQIAGLITLNRSFGIVPAKREIKTSGLYRIARHPLYASYLVSNTGYVLTNTTARNFILYIAIMALLFFRLLREERHLAMDARYREYMEQVRYRVIPFIS